MASLFESYPELRSALRHHYGPVARVGRADPFEAIIAAWLARTYSPAKLDLILESLRAEGLLESEALAAADLGKLHGAFAAANLAPAQPVLATIKRLSRWFGSFNETNAIADQSSARLRDSLRAIKGVGPATVDAILLYGLGRPVFPVGRAALRILGRHGWVDSFVDYDEASDQLRGVDPENPSALIELDTRLDQVGDEFCPARGPNCERCPLRSLLPASGPLDLESS